MGEVSILPAGGGSGRIRTAVEAFAELCLATRPRNLLFLLSPAPATFCWCLRTFWLARRENGRYLLPAASGQQPFFEQVRN